MNHVRDAVYGIVAHPTMPPAQQAEMLKRLADANAQASKIEQTNVMGPLGGVSDTHLRPELAPLVPKGAARPYAPGEYTMNPDRSWSSERSMTVPNPDGSWTVIPSLWLKDGHPYEAQNEDEAMRLAQASKLPFKKFKTLQEADKFSIDRESAWQPIQRPEDADKIAPLWDMAPAAKPARESMRQGIQRANGMADRITQTAVPMPAQVAPPSAAFPTAGTPPVASFAPMPAGPSLAAGTPPTAAVASFPGTAPSDAGDEIDRQKMLALAAMAKPTTYPSL